jgi:hypothetical protein
MMKRTSTIWHDWGILTSDSNLQILRQFTAAAWLSGFNNQTKKLGVYR